MLATDIESVLKRFKNAHILVAGEVGIDEYLWGDTRRISPEAPVPVIEVHERNEMLGLSANVAQNISSLGGKVTLLGIRGDDNDGERLSHLISANGIDHVELITDPSRPTLRKVRILARKQHVVRVDYERAHSLSAEVATQFSRRLEALMEDCDVIITQDYGKGIWSPDTMAFVKRAKELGKPVLVDPSRGAPLSRYRGTTLLTPNYIEALNLTGTPEEINGEPPCIKTVAQKILKETEAEHVVITCGAAGMVCLSRTETELKEIPTSAREVFDVTGAGDTVVAVMALCTAAELGVTDSMHVANAAAGIVVGRIGASKVTPTELQSALFN